MSADHLTVLPDDQLIRLGWQHTLSDVTSTGIVRQMLPLCAGYGIDAEVCSKIDEDDQNMPNCRHHSESDDEEDEEQSLGSIPSTLISLFRSYLLNNNTHKISNDGVSTSLTEVTEVTTRDSLDRTLSTITEESSGENFEFEIDGLEAADLDGEVVTDTVEELAKSNVDVLFRDFRAEEFGSNKSEDSLNGCVEKYLSKVIGLTTELQSVDQCCMDEHVSADHCREALISEKVANWPSRVRWSDEDPLVRGHLDIISDPERQSRPDEPMTRTSGPLPWLPEDRVHDVISDALRKLYVDFDSNEDEDNITDEKCDATNQFSSVDIDPQNGDRISPLKPKYSSHALCTAALTRRGSNQPPQQQQQYIYSPPDVVVDDDTLSSVEVESRFDDVTRRTAAAGVTAKSAMLAVARPTDRLVSHRGGDDDDQLDDAESHESSHDDLDVDLNTRCSISGTIADGGVSSTSLSERGQEVSEVTSSDDRLLPSGLSRDTILSCHPERQLSKCDNGLPPPTPPPPVRRQSVDDKVAVEIGTVRTPRTNSAIRQPPSCPSLQEDNNKDIAIRPSQKCNSAASNNASDRVTTAVVAGLSNVDKRHQRHGERTTAHQRPSYLKIKTNNTDIKTTDEHSRTSGSLHLGRSSISISSSSNVRTSCTAVSSSFENLVDTLLCTPSPMIIDHRVPHQMTLSRPASTERLGCRPVVDGVRKSACDLVGRGAGARIDGLSGLLIELVSVNSNHQPLSSLRPPTASVAHRGSSRVKKHRLSCIKRRTSDEFDD